MKIWTLFIASLLALLVIGGCSQEAADEGATGDGVSDAPTLPDEPQKAEM